MHRTLARLSVLLLLVGIAESATAQIPRILREAATRTAGRAVAERIGYSDLMNRAPIRTSLQDARWAAPGYTAAEPPGGPTALTRLERTRTGGFVLRPGFYQMHVQSYCLHAGTHGPGGGEGYLYAPPLGPAEDVVVAILQNSVQRPQIEQRDVQQLLWAIVARAQFEDLNPRLRAVASQLLTPRQLATLNRDALGTGLELALQGAPPLVRQTLEAEQRLRSMLTSSSGSFLEMEAVAVLSGAVGEGTGSRNVPSGQWSRHPDGYHVRYLPQGYTNTVVQVYVEPRSAAVGRTFDPATHIAVPGNTARQRLAQSARPYGRS